MIKSQNKNAPEPYVVNGKNLVCHQCSNDKFFVKHPVILFASDFMNTKTTCFICSECTHMHWFESDE